jgi:DNA-binding NarL/FixJ family response regulator
VTAVSEGRPDPLCVQLAGLDPLTSDVLSRLLAREGFAVNQGDADVWVVAMTQLGGEAPPAVSGPWLALVEVPTAALQRTAKRAGAAGLVDRRSGISALTDAVRAVAAGEAPPAADTGDAGALSGLSQRQITVLRLISNGASNATIATELGISPNTARTHVQNLLAKLGVSNRLAAAAVGRAAGLDRDSTS